jgi:hypothetical protein
VGVTSRFSTPSRSRWLALGAATVVAVGAIGASELGAQTVADPIVIQVVSVDETGATQDVPDTVVAAMSDTGAVVAYDTSTPVPVDDVPADDTDPAEPAPPIERVWIRDRVGATSRPVAEVGSVAPGISGDGCLVAYSVISGDDASAVAALTVVDRCAAAPELPLPVGTVLDTITPAVGSTSGSGSSRVASPAMSFDGSTIVWSTGTEIRRYERPAVGQPFARAHTFDVSTTPSPDVVTGAAVDVSADGRSVVFVAGPGVEPFVPTPANVYAWTLSDPASEPELLSSTASGEAGVGDSGSPSIAADGSFVVFGSTSLDLAVVGESTVVGPFVVGVDRVASTTQVLVDDAVAPTVSADGLHVAYRRGDAIRLLSWVDGVTVDTGPDELAAARPTGAVAISQHGRWLVFASEVDFAAAPPADPPPADPPGQGEPVASTALWAADRSSSAPDVVDTTTTTSSTTTTTTTSTSTTTTSTTTPPDGNTTTTSVDVEGPATSVTQPTVPTTTLAPRSVFERFPTGTSSFPRVFVPNRSTGSSRSTPSQTSSTTFGSVAPTAGPVVFERTVVDAGRRVLPVTLFNSSTNTVGITLVSVDGGGPFSIVSDLCSGLRLAPSSSCAVDVQFAPTAVGVVTGLVTFQLDDGTIATASVDGEGVPGPTLDLLPAVAGAGQTVTVFGVGFPPGSTVQLTQPGVALPQPVVVDAAGTFAHVVVVLPNTPTGPVLLTVVGQPDTFADVDAELLVSSRGATSGGAAVRSGPSSPSQR